MVAEAPEKIASGRRVRIRDLKGKPELNGREGKCHEFTTASGRWSVRLIDGSSFSLKEDNLELLPNTELALTLGSCAQQGLRSTQEDRHVKIPNLEKAAAALKIAVELPTPSAYFAVYDGHQGHACAEYIAKNLHVRVLRQLAVQDPSTAAGAAEVEAANTVLEGITAEAATATPAQNVPKVASSDLSQSPASASPSSSSSSAVGAAAAAPVSQEKQQQQQQPSVEEDRVVLALRRAFLELDREYLQRFRTVPDGCTALVGLSLGDRLFLAWAGDSRALLGRRQALPAAQSAASRGSSSPPSSPPTAMMMMGEVTVAEALSKDHKADSSTEAERIRKVGGSVVNIGDGCWRVAQGDYEARCREITRAEQQGLGTIGKMPVALAVARSLGDRDFKAVTRGSNIVTADPEVHVLKLDPSCKFVVLMSDGVTDVMTNQEIVTAVDQFLGPKLPTSMTRTEEEEAEIARMACNSLLQESLRRGTGDNVTAIIVKFRWGERAEATYTAALAAAAAAAASSSPSSSAAAAAASSAAGLEAAKTTETAAAAAPNGLKRSGGSIASLPSSTIKATTADPAEKKLRSE